jgi:hypothetical protein
VAEAVDAILRGRELPVELRYRDESGEVHLEKALLPQEGKEPSALEPEVAKPLAPLRVYPYGVNQSYLDRAGEELDLPVEVVKSSLAEVFGVEKRVDPFALALQETQEAIREVLAGARSMELSPQNAYIRRKQHEMAREANLISRSRGKEPRRRVRIYQNEAD